MNYTKLWQPSCVTFAIVTMSFSAFGQEHTQHQRNNITGDATHTQYTNRDTEHDPDDGCIVGIKADEHMEIRQNESNHIYFYTDWANFPSQVPRMTIRSSGRVGINESNPQERLDVDGRVRVQNLPNSSFPIPAIITRDGNNVLNQLLLNGSGNQALGDDGNWHSFGSLVGAQQGLSLDGTGTLVELGEPISGSPVSPFSINRGVDLNDNNFILDWQDTDGRVGVGTPSPIAKFSVQTAQQQETGYFKTTFPSSGSVVEIDYDVTSSIGSSHGLLVRGLPAEYGAEIRGGAVGLDVDADAATYTAWPHRQGIVTHADHPSATGSTNITGVDAFSGSSTTNCNFAKGVHGFGETNTSGTAYGGHFYGRSNNTAYGIFSEAHGTSSTSGSVTAGDFLADANGGPTAIGGKFDASGGTNNYGILVTGGNVGIGTSTPSATYQLDVVGGDIRVSGTVYTSDVRFKDDIQPIEKPMDKLLQLNGVSYQWRTDEFPEKQFRTNQDIGFIAQEVEQILPEVVSSDDKGFKGIDYARITPLLVEGIKQQQGIIETQNQKLASTEAANESLTAEIDLLKEEMNNMANAQAAMQTQMAKLMACLPADCEVNKKPDNVGNVEAISNDKMVSSDRKGNRLEQNVPNPFMDQTNISYTIANEGEVQLKVFDQKGNQIIQLVNAFQTAGDYTINWPTADIAPGMYIYVLTQNDVELTRKAIKVN